MPKEVIELGDQSLEIRWNKNEDPHIQIGVIADEDFVFIHTNRGFVVIDNEPFDSLWATIHTKNDALRLISAVKSAMKYLAD